MNTQLRLIAAVVATLAMGHASAQTYGNPYARSSSYGYGHSQVVRCESAHSQRTYCRVNSSGNVGNVQLRRQLSQSACIRGRTWANDSRGIWVSNGCRAEFSIGARRYSRADNGYASSGNGYYRDGDYRDNGSRYGDRYESQYGNDGYSSYQNDGYRDGNYGDGSSYSNGSSRTIRCSSTSDGRTYCRNESNGTVQLSRTYGGRCAQGETWGTDGRGIWVSGDCSASFNVIDRSDYTNNYDENDSGYYQH